MTVRELVRKTAENFRAGGIEDPKGEAERLYLHAAGLGFSAYLASLEEEAPAECTVRYEEYAKRRMQREPLQHIVGSAPFYGRTFKVDPRVLVPRFDTEILVQEAVRELEGRETVLDLCTGSGCIAITLKKEMPDLRVLASDVSKDALDVARENAALLEADVEFVESDMFKGLTEPFDVLVSNPPYIARAAIGKLEPEVRDHDPVIALDGGADGLCFYRKIAKCAKRHFTPSGTYGGRPNGNGAKRLLILEIGDEQAEEVTQILKKEGYEGIVTVPDLSGRARVVKAVYEG